MTQYALGTVAVTNGSAVVTGTDTNWLSSGIAADGLLAIQDEFVWYDVLTVDSDTQITLKTNYTGTTKTAQPYVAQLSFTPNQNFPTPTFGDIGTAGLLAKSLLQIDADLTTLSPMLSLLQGDLVFSGVAEIDATQITLTPGSSVTPTTNGQMAFELTSNTLLKIKVKGSDGTVRSVSLTLA